MKAASQYFLIRINRKSQRDKKDRLGSIIVAPDHTHMQYNMQCGEIVNIGERAHREFPEAKIGHIAIIHHFVEGEGERDAKENYLVDFDDTYNYYVVTPCEVPGKNIDVYGVWDGEKIIPHKSYIFLSPDPTLIPATADEYINSALQKTESGLFVFSDWKETYEDLVEKQEKIKQQIQSLSSSMHVPGAKDKIQSLERELESISLKINRRSYHPYVVEFANPVLREWFSRPVSTGDQLFIDNITAQTHVDFRDKKYRIAPTKAIGAIKV